MVNHLMRKHGTQPAGLCLIRWKGPIDGGIGGRPLKLNDEGRCSWTLARLLRKQGDCIILEYDESVLEANPAPEPPAGASPEKLREWSADLDVSEHPGFFCKVCLAQGKISRFARTISLRSHAAIHTEGPRPSWPKGRPRDPKKIRAIAKRKYNTDYQRERRQRQKEARGRGE